MVILLTVLLALLIVVLIILVLLILPTVLQHTFIIDCIAKHVHHGKLYLIFLWAASLYNDFPIFFYACLLSAYTINRRN